MWRQIFENMSTEKIPYQKFYIQNGNGGGITYVSPTEQNRLQAQSMLKRQIAEEVKNIPNKAIKKIKIMKVLKKKKKNATKKEKQTVMNDKKKKKKNKKKYIKKQKIKSKRKY